MKHWVSNTSTSFHVRKVLSIAFTFSFFMFSFLLISCGGKGSDSKGSIDDREQTIEGNEGKVTIVPIYRLDDDNNLYAYKFTLKLPTGEYMKFDNDADYSQYVGTLLFMDYIHRSIVAESVREMEKSGERHFDSERARQIRTVGPTVVHDVLSYLNGKKETIEDKNNLQVIEEAYYNFHPERWITSLDEESYNHKSYVTQQPSSSGYCRTSVFPRSRYENEYIDSSGEEIVEDMIVFDIW